MYDIQLKYITCPLSNDTDLPSCSYESHPLHSVSQTRAQLRLASTRSRTAAVLADTRRRPSTASGSHISLPGGQQWLFIGKLMLVVYCIIDNQSMCVSVCMRVSINWENISTYCSMSTSKQDNTIETNKAINSRICGQVANN